MTKLRISVLAFAVGAITACSEPSLPDVTAPSALAASGGNAVSHTICSGPGTELSFDRVAWFPAYPTIPQGPYGATIGESHNSGVTNAPIGYSYYRTIFSLPADTKGFKLEGSLHADNQAAVSFNGTQFFQQLLQVAYQNFQSPEDPFSTNAGAVPGAANTVVFDLYNAGGAAALDFCYTISYQSATESSGDGGGDPIDAQGCPAAPAVAARILHDLGVKPNSALAKRILARVGDHMTQGAKFGGFDKCDPRYPTAVAVFVAPLLPGSD